MKKKTLLEKETRAPHAGAMLGSRCWTVKKFQVTTKRHNSCKNTLRVISLHGMGHSFDSEHNYVQSFNYASSVITEVCKSSKFVMPMPTSVPTPVTPRS